MAAAPPSPQPLRPRSPSSLPASPLGGAAPIPLPSAFCFPRRGLAQPRSPQGMAPPISLFPQPSPAQSSSRVPPPRPGAVELRGKDCGGPGSPRRPCTWKRELTWRRRRQPQPLRRNCIVRAICTKPGGRRPPHPGIFLIYFFFFVSRFSSP